MIRIGLVGDDVPRTLQRVLPADAGGVWRGCRFAPFDEQEEFDWVVVLHRGLTEPVRFVGDPDNIAYVSMEPREPPLVGPGYLAQFSRVVATSPRLRHPGLVRRTGIGWWIGISVDHDGGHRHRPGVRLTYDDLVDMATPTTKARRVSIVTSTARFGVGHRARDRLVAHIAAHPIARHVDIYGGGRRPIPDKWDAILPDAYHLALENSVIPDYWTEKLSDAFLGFALPLYFGCPNIDEYFPAESIVPIDAFRPAAAIEVIERTLDENAWGQRVPAILEARGRILDDHHPLSVIAGVCDRPAGTSAPITLLPPNRFPVGRIAREWWRTKRRIYSRTRGLHLGDRPLWRTAP